jgi:hypothetical protein
MTTGSKCDEVYKMNFSGATSDRLVAMKEWTTAGGDSGGPWFHGNTAYGVHKGSVELGIPKKLRSVFSQARYIDEGIGVNILIYVPPPPPCVAGAVCVSNTDCGAGGTCYKGVSVRAQSLLDQGTCACM